VFFKVNDNVSIYRYDNGFMVEIGGRDLSDEWINKKFVANTLDEVIEVIKDYNTLPLAE
jgi:hypothetical protein